MQQQPLTLLDILNRRPTTSNMIEFVRQTTRTNNAAIQGAGSSPSGQYDGQPYTQSAIARTLYQAAVRTIGTYIPASRQILADATQLQGRIDGELRYMLAVEREDQLLNGDGSGGNIDGLLNQASDFNGGVTNATALDTILRSFLQLTLAYYQADAVVLNPTDWHNMVMLKDTEGRYLFSDPQSGARPALWGRPVAQCFSLAAGTFLSGNFGMGATVWDRQDASVRIAEQHDDFAIRGMVAVIADERLALEVSHPGAFVTGNVSHAG
jgi:HK97 family phage major capsid protein